MTEKSSERCVLCLDEKRSPVRIICGHSFCNECLDVYKSYQKYAWANRCPICRGSLKEKRRSVKKKNETASANATSTSTSTSSSLTITSTTTPTSTTSIPITMATTTAATINDAIAPIEQIYLLEEFMAIAADSDANMEEEEDDGGMELEDDDEEFYSEEEQDDYYYFDDDDVDTAQEEDEDEDEDEEDNDRNSDNDEDVVTLDEVIIVD